MSRGLGVSAYRPHVLGLDDGPFVKDQGHAVPIVGVMMEGAHLVEAVAITHFPVDGPRAAEFLGDWIGGLRFAPALQAVVLGGITIAGLGVVDIGLLSAQLGVPVLAINRHVPTNESLLAALEAAGLEDRAEILTRHPPAWPAGDGVFVAHAGADQAEALRLVLATRHKSQLPEPLRLAHLIGAALVRGESRGRP